MMAMMHDDGMQGILSLRGRAKTIRLSVKAYRTEELHRM